ncbi:MAG: mechanosensitive ion channel family protein [Cyanobacteria bacterium P01_H01_bin.58]
MAAPAYAQWPLVLNQSSSDANEVVFGWRPNAAYPCGRLVCSDVYLYGSKGISFTVAGPTQATNGEAEVLDVETRAQLVQRSFREVLRTLEKQERVQQTLQTVNSRWTDIIRSRSELHPSTPRVEVGIENDQTVVFLLDQPDYGLQPQTLVTINEFDAVQNGEDKEELASTWQTAIRNGLSDALWEQSFDQQYPWARLLMAIALLILAALATIGLEKVRGWFRRRTRVLRKRLKASEKELQKSIAIDPEAITPDTIQPTSPDPEQLSILLPSEETFKPLIAMTEASESVNQLLLGFSKGFLKEQTLFKQQRNLTKFGGRLLFWLEVCVGFGIAGAIARLYPIARPYAPYIFGQAILLPVIWLSIAVVDTLIDVEVDYHLNQWGKETQPEDPRSSRVALRVSTYSPAIKSATTVLFTALGAYLTIQAFGIDPTVLASAGAIAVVAAFVSRNVLQDMLNGAVILWTDRFAVGDVITVGTYTGLVEDMSLYTTQIRGAEGRLITVPNGQISIVENLTKDWSRVDFTIEIACDADIKQALELIRAVAEGMLADPLWQDKILEPASILGVDQISHSGILLQVWIKTQAMQQWAVGREFRLRVKQTFDESKIAIGWPQQTVILRR